MFLWWLIWGILASFAVEEMFQKGVLILLFCIVGELFDIEKVLKGIERKR